MNYERKYKEALERARTWRNKSGMPIDKQGILDEIFPELKEPEDENVLEDIEEAIINYWHGDTQDILLDWLKSLKPKNTWKPSDEQIDALDFAADCIVPAEFCVKRKVLKELLEQLKKLKG